jgi:predicted nucleic acid-binding protein
MIFIDTLGLYAVMDRHDDKHEIAAVIWHRLIAGSARLITTNYIVVETLALVQARLGFEAARRLALDVFPIFEQTIVDAGLHHAALEALLEQKRRKLSLVDCVSFTCMRRLHITTAFSFDPHFVEAGFTLLV